MASPWLGVFVQTPMSVTFVGYTNRTAVMVGGDVINLPRAVFDLSNHSASPLSWMVTTEALGRRGNAVVVPTDPLSAHSVDRIEVIIPGGSEDGVLS
jgi:hypothetical protein